MEDMTDTHRRFFRENPRAEIKWKTVQTEYLKWLEELARKQLAYNDALQLVSSCSNERADKLEERLRRIEKRFERFDKNYD